MKLSFFGRMALALVASLALGLGMTACGGGTIGYLWVIGSQYNQIAGFKVDDYTGNLTQIPGAPFSVSGANPVDILIRPGGRYIYVLNQGSGGSQGVRGASSGISVFAVGGDGTLTYQVGYQSQGFVPIYEQFDSTGNFLYVLDRYSPSGDGNGSITAFQIDPNTGRLTLVTNSQTQVNGVNTAYFEVGAKPRDDEVHGLLPLHSQWCGKFHGRVDYALRHQWSQRSAHGRNERHAPRASVQCDVDQRRQQLCFPHGV